MTDVSEQDNTEQDLEVNYNQVPDNRDWFLASLIGALNSGRGSIGLTLCVSGFMVSGTAVSGREYFDLLSREMVEGLQEGKERDEIATNYAKFGDIYEPDEGSSLAPFPSYIHLKNAKIFTPGAPPSPSNHGILWRGRLAAVDGFWLGILQHKTA